MPIEDDAQAPILQNEHEPNKDIEVANKPAAEQMFGAEPVPKEHRKGNFDAKINAPAAEDYI